MRRAAKLAAALGIIAFTGGCSTFDHIEFTLASAPPVAASVSYDEIRIPEGVAVITVATPMSTEGQMSSDTTVELQSADPSVLGAAFALPNGGTSGAQWTFVLLGVAAGNATVVVSVDGTEEKRIPAVVEAQ